MEAFGPLPFSGKALMQLAKQVKFPENVEALQEALIPKQKKPWPWWLRPVSPYQGSRQLVQCECGRVMFLDSPGNVKRYHLGHRMSSRVAGTKWDFIKMKLGWLDSITFSEWLQKYQEEKLS